MKPQPLTFKRRLMWSIELFTQNILTVVALSLLAFVATITVSVAGMGLGLAELFGSFGQFYTPDVMTTPPDPMAIMAMLFSPTVIIGLLFVMLISGLLMFWYQAAMYLVPVDSLITGERAKIKSVLKKSLLRLPDFMTTVGLVMVIIFLMEIAVGLLSAATMGDPLFALIIGIAALILMIWLSLSFILAGPVALLENHAPFGTLSRTLYLVDGMRWRMLGHFLLLGLTIIVASLLAFVPLWLGTMVGGIVAAILGFVSFILWIIVAFGIIFVSLFFAESFYFEIRALKGHWKAGWGDVPDESWPLADEPDDVEIAVGGRGTRAWLEFALLSVVLMALIYGAALLLPPPSSMSMMSQSTQMNMSPHPMAPMISGGNGPAFNIDIAQPEPALNPSAQPVQPQAVDSTASASGDSISSAPVRVELIQDNFWEDKKSPSLWLKTEIKGLSLPDDGIDLSNILRIQITKISDHQGNDIYNHDSQMEEPFFQNVNLQHNNNRLHGIRNVHLLKGSSLDDIASISGQLTVIIPNKIERHIIKQGDTGKTVEAKALSINLRSIESRKLTLDISGFDNKRRFLGVIAITDNGRLAPRSWSSSGGEQLIIGYDFDRDYKQAELLVANQIIEKFKSFTLNQKAATIELN